MDGVFVDTRGRTSRYEEAKCQYHEIRNLRLCCILITKLVKHRLVGCNQLESIPRSDISHASLPSPQPGTRTLASERKSGSTDLRIVQYGRKNRFSFLA